MVKKGQRKTGSKTEWIMEVQRCSSEAGKNTFKVQQHFYFLL